MAAEAAAVKTAPSAMYTMLAREGVNVAQLINAVGNDAGKDAEPQDHNRDWSDHPHWNEVIAAKRSVTSPAP